MNIHQDLLRYVVLDFLPLRELYFIRSKHPQQYQRRLHKSFNTLEGLSDIIALSLETLNTELYKQAYQKLGYFDEEGQPVHEAERDYYSSANMTNIVIQRFVKGDIDFALNFVKVAGGMKAPYIEDPIKYDENLTSWFGSSRKAYQLLTSDEILFNLKPNLLALILGPLIIKGPASGLDLVIPTILKIYHRYGHIPNELKLGNENAKSDMEVLRNLEEEIERRMKF
jgi:hypothetical protein